MTELSTRAGDPPLDLRLVPVTAATWGAAWLGTAGRLPLTLGALGLAVGLGLLAARRRSTRLAAVAVMLACAAGLGGLHAHRLASSPLARLAAEGSIVAAEAVVRSDPRVTPGAGARPGYATVRLTVHGASGRGTTWRLRSPVLVVASGSAMESVGELVVGTRVALVGRLAPADPGSPLAAVLRIREPVVTTAPPGPGLAAVERVRAGLRAAVAGRAAEPRALVPALVLGDESGLPPDLVTDFQTTGLTHLTAVSGANLTLLLAFVLTAARWGGVRGWWLRALGLATVVVFIALCRTEPSVLRAAAMGLVALAALGVGGRRAGIRNLMVAAFVLLLGDPFLARSVGFTLSVLASAGIIVWARAWADVLHRWLPRAVGELVAVPLAAHLATAPVVAAISGQVSVVGLLANAIAGPFVGPATVLGFAAAGVSLVSAPLAAMLGFGAAWSAQVIVWTARLGAELPGAAWRWPTSPAALVGLGLVSLLLGLVMAHLLARRWLAVGLAAALVVLVAHPPPQPGWPMRDWRFVACDVGQGDGLVLRTAPRQAVVIDAGPDPPAIRRCLDQLRITAVPLLVLTHLHADHVDGITGVWAGRSVGQVWVSTAAAPADELAEVSRIAAGHGTSVHTPQLGERVQVGAAQVSVLGPVAHPSIGLTESSAQNDASLVLHAEVDGLSVLLTGDVEPPGQQAILAAGIDVRADVLKVPHHGSARQDRAFFAATGARVAIASAGVDNDYGHPAPRTIQLAESLGMAVWHTDTAGAVAVTRRDGAVLVDSQR